MTRPYKTILVLILAVVLAGAAGLVRAEAVQIVSVDMQRIWEVHPAIRAVEQQLHEESLKLQEQLEELDDEEAGMMMQQMQQELQMLQHRLVDQALEDISADIAAVAEDKGYDYVLDTNSLIVGGRDVTDEIIEALDLAENGAEVE